MFSFVVSNDVNVPVCMVPLYILIHNDGHPQITLAIQRVYGNLAPLHSSIDTYAPPPPVTVYCEVVLSSHGEPIGLPLLSPYGRQDAQGATFGNCILTFPAKVR